MEEQGLLGFRILEWPIWVSDIEAKSEGQILDVCSHCLVHQGEEWQFAPAAELPCESSWGTGKKKKRHCKNRVLPQHCNAERFRENQSQANLIDGSDFKERQSYTTCPTFAELVTMYIPNIHMILLIFKSQTVLLKQPQKRYVL